MNKIVKGILITLVVIACIIFIPSLILKSQINNVTDTPKAENITDLSLTFDSTYEIAEGDIKVQVPTSFASTKLNQFSAVMCVSQDQKELMVVYYPFGPVADTIIPGYSKQLDKLFAQYEESEPEYPWTLIVDKHDDLFDTMSDILLADKDSYDFWNFKHNLNLLFYLKARERMEESQYDYRFCGVYERDDVRAVAIEDLNNKGTYIVMIFPEYEPEDLYAFVIKTNDMDDVTKILNTYELNGGF